MLPPSSPAPIPPIGSFVNVSDGLQSMLPDVPQYPYTGPLLKKAGAAAAAASTADTTPVAKVPLPVVVPSFAAWFDMAAIHEIERACQRRSNDITVW